MFENSWIFTVGRELVPGGDSRDGEKGEGLCFILEMELSGLDS